MRKGGSASEERLPVDGEVPSRWIFVRLGDHGANRADFSFVAIQCLHVVHIPELHVLFPVRIVVDLAPPLDLPEGERIFERWRYRIGPEVLSYLFLSSDPSVARTRIYYRGSVHSQPSGTVGEKMGLANWCGANGNSAGTGVGHCQPANRCVSVLLIGVVNKRLNARPFGTVAAG